MRSLDAFQDPPESATVQTNPCGAWCLSTPELSDAIVPENLIFHPQASFKSSSGQARSVIKLMAGIRRGKLSRLPHFSCCGIALLVHDGFVVVFAHHRAQPDLSASFECYNSDLARSNQQYI